MVFVKSKSKVDGHTLIKYDPFWKPPTWSTQHYALKWKQSNTANSICHTIANIGPNHFTSWQLKQLQFLRATLYKDQESLLFSSTFSQRIIIKHTNNHSSEHFDHIQDDPQLISTLNSLGDDADRSYALVGDHGFGGPGQDRAGPRIVHARHSWG